MYLDFEDYRPEIPRVPSAISRREGLLIAVVLHLVLFILIVLFPSAFTSERVVQAVPAKPAGDVPRFVFIEPLVERPAPPRLTAPLSDLDRRAASPLRPPVPKLPDPYAVGNTSERVIGSPEERRMGADGAPSLRAVPQSPPSVAAGAGLATAIPTPPVPTGSGRFGESLRNLQQYLQDQNFNNPRGGEGPQDPLIQFDSKGVEFGPWLRRFVAQVKRNWYVPLMPLRGRVVIQFYVNRNGSISELKVVQPSTVESFTTAAFNALKLSNPTLALPPEYPDERALFTVTFHYNEGIDR